MENSWEWGRLKSAEFRPEIASVADNVFTCSRATCHEEQDPQNDSNSKFLTE